MARVALAVVIALAALFPTGSAGIDALDDLCYRVRWNHKSSNPKQRLVRPVTAFPAEHAMVTPGVCGGKIAGDRIPEHGQWSTSGSKHYGDKSCKPIDGGSVFYAYNFPAGASSNTGFERADTDLIYFVVDEAGQVNFVLVHDKAMDGSGGHVNIAIQTTSQALKGGGVKLLTRDDPGTSGTKAECYVNTHVRDCYWYDELNVEGYFSHLWAPCCTDGLVLGPMPTTDWSFEILYDFVRGIDNFQIGNFDPTTNTMNFLDMDKAAVENSGIEVSAFSCSDYCAELSCGECTLDPACGWCSNGGCLSLSKQDTCTGDFAAEGCCAECAVHDTCQDCINNAGCGWSYSLGKCLSGSSDLGLCEASDWYQVHNAHVSTCRSVPGPVLSDNPAVPVPTVQNTAVLDWCSGHGTHSFGTDYACTCDPGYFGEDCASECPGGHVSPCSGHGSCDRLTGACLCECGFGGANGDCSAPLDCHCRSDSTDGDDGEDGDETSGQVCLYDECLHPCGRVASGTGTCTGAGLGFLLANSAAARRHVNGSVCACGHGWWGEACNKACPGIDPITGAGNVCGGRGRCDVVSGQCECAPCHMDDGSGACVPKACPDCKNGACECDLDTGDMVCRCAGNWKGTLCKGCKCQNGGACSAFTGVCECPAGFYGELCEFECSRDSLCHGHGECNVTQLQCDCDTDYIGSTENQCRFHCPPDKCGAHGFCSPTTGECKCAKGYAGTPCVPACDAGVCKNGATCSYDDTTALGYVCDCSTAPGYYGAQCGLDKNECELSTPCEHVCTNTPGSYDCSCHAGYALAADGSSCENIDDCPTTDACNNNGNCTDALLDYTCACYPGFNGTRCEINIDDCPVTHSCGHGTCVDGVQAYTCACDAGWTGETCGDDVDECAQGTHTCSQYATCTNTIGSYGCACRAGFSGDGYTCADVTAPVITCPRTHEAAATGPSVTVTYPNPTVSDNVAVTSLTCSPAAGTVFDLGSAVIDCIAHDAAGNSATCAFDVVVVDDGAPVLTCPSDVAVTTPQGSATAIASWTDVAVTDNSGEVPAVTLTHASSSSFAIGTTTVQATATDSAGNTGSCTFAVRVTDAEVPTIVCPSDLVQATDGGSASAVVTWPKPATSDNSNGEIFLTYNKDHFSGYAFPLGKTYVKIEARDPSGNMADCSFIVRVEDHEPPHITQCPGAATFPTLAGRAVGSVTWPDLQAVDNSGSAVSGAYSPPRTENFVLGDTTVTATATDRFGNAATCAFVITVVDVEAPVVACPADSQVETDAGLSTAVVVHAEAPVTDNSGETLSASYAPASGSKLPIGVNVVRAKAVDAAGNAGRCNVTVTVLDTELPVVTCPADVILEADHDKSTTMGLWADASASDNSGTAPALAYTPAHGSTFELGVTTVHATATDSSGNVAECTFTLTVEDVQAPVVACPGDMSVPLDPGMPEGTASWTVPTAADNSGAAPDIALSAASGSGFPLGTTAVHVTATDAAGNAAACSFAVFVFDDEEPRLTCPSDLTAPTTIGGNTAIVEYPLAASDGSGTPPTVSCTPASGSTFDLGSSSVACTATDEAGNWAECHFQLTVRDEEPPTVSCSDDISVNADPDSTEATVTYTAPTATDNIALNGTASCDVASGSVLGSGPHTIHCTARDTAGNVGLCTFTATVVDMEPPTITCPTDGAAETDAGRAVATVTLATATASDNDMHNPLVIACSHQDEVELSLGLTDVTCSATDGSGNTASCVYQMVVTDPEPPVLVGCAGTQEVPTSPGLATGTPGYTLPTAADNSGSSPTVSCSPLADDALAMGIHTVACSATDAAGNTGHCTWDVTVYDGEPPVVTCPAGVTAVADAGQAYASGVAIGSPSATDNSGSLAAPAACVLPEDGHWTLGETRVKCHARDEAGNVGECMLTVLVVDEEPPVITCPKDVFASTNAGEASATLIVPLATASDASGTTPTVTCTHAGRVTLDVGTTDVSCTATDAAGNAATCGFLIRVQDREAPVVTCPSVALVVGNEPGLASAVVTFVTPPAKDNVDVAADLAITCTPASGSRFALGSTTVTCRAVDLAGNAGTCSFTVRVEDREAPVLTCPSPWTATVPYGTTSGSVTFDPPVVTDNDGDDSSPDHKCTPESGAVLSLGKHTIVCKAADARGNTGQCSTEVTVVEGASTTTTAAPSTTTASPSTSTTTTVASATTTAGAETTTVGSTTTTVANTTTVAGSDTTTGADSDTTTVASTTTAAPTTTTLDSGSTTIAPCPAGWTGADCTEDINECASDALNECSHGCENYDGGYSCTCPSSLTLASDGKNCVSTFSTTVVEPAPTSSTTTTVASNDGTTTTGTGGDGSATTAAPGTTAAPTTTVSTQATTTTTTTSTSETQVRLTETLRFSNPECVPTESHIELVLQEDVPGIISDHVGTYALDGVTVVVYPVSVGNAVQIDYSFKVRLSQQAAADIAMEAAAQAVSDAMTTIDASAASADCVFFDGFDFTRDTDAETIDSDGGGSTTGSGNVTGVSSFVVIAVVAAVILLMVVVLGAMRLRRRGENGFALGSAAGGAGGEFANPMYNAAERNVAYDNPIYDDLDVDSDSDGNDDERDITVLVAPTRPSFARGASRQSLEWQDMP